MARRKEAKIKDTYELLRAHARNQSGVSSLWYVVNLAVTLERTLHAAKGMYLNIGRHALNLTYNSKGPKIESGVVANSVLREVSSVVWDAGQLAEYASLEILNSVEMSLTRALKDVQKAQSERPEFIAGASEQATVSN